MKEALGTGLLLHSRRYQQLGLAVFMVFSRAIAGFFPARIRQPVISWYNAERIQYATIGIQWIIATFAERN